LFCDAGVITLVTFISPFESDRRKTRDLLQDRYVEIYVNVTIETAEKRDPKGLYKKARNGEIKDFTGIDSPYEEPLNPELVLDSKNQSVTKCAQKVFLYLERRHFISKIK
jgi:adenylylsulfate kinase